MDNVFVHPTALVETASIGEGTRVWAYVHILPGAVIGRNCNIGDHCFIEGGVHIGDDVTIKNGNMLWEGVTIADGAFVGPAVVFTNDRYPRSPRAAHAGERYRRKEGWLLPTRVGRGATLGAGAVILAGVTIGDYAMVAAGAVVTRDVPPYALVRGNPAAVRGWVCACGQPLRFQEDTATCAACGRRFRREKSALEPTEDKENRP